MDNDNESIVNMLNYYAEYAFYEIFEIEAIPDFIFNEIIDTTAHNLAFDYLIKNDWAKKTTISNISVALFEGGKYLGKHSHNSLREDDKTFSNFEYMYKQLLKSNKTIDFGKKTNAAIRQAKEQMVSGKYKFTKKLKENRKSRITIQPFEIIDLLAIYYLNTNIEFEKCKKVNDKFNRNNKLHLIQHYEDFELMIDYFKMVYKCNSPDNKLVSSNEIQKIIAEVDRLTELGIIDKAMVNSPIYKFYLYQTLECKYGLETIKTFASCISQFNKKTERAEKNVRDTDRETFKKDMFKTYVLMPLCKTRYNFIESYIEYYKENTLETWLYLIKSIFNIIRVTNSSIIQWLNEKPKEKQEQLYRELIVTLNNTEYIKTYTALDTNYKYNVDFKQVHFRAALKTIDEAGEDNNRRILAANQIILNNILGTDISDIDMEEIKNDKSIKSDLSEEILNDIVPDFNNHFKSIYDTAVELANIDMILLE